MNFMKILPNLLAVFMATILLQRCGHYGHFVVKQSQQISRRDVSQTLSLREHKKRNSNRCLQHGGICFTIVEAEFASYTTATDQQSRSAILREVEVCPDYVDKPQLTN
jgi:hypothetical protein